MELNYKVVFSKCKTLTISVERDRSVVVTAPEGLRRKKFSKSLNLVNYGFTRKPGTLKNTVCYRIHRVKS
jgi:hypothetical protein